MRAVNRVRAVPRRALWLVVPLLMGAAMTLRAALRLTAPPPSPPPPPAPDALHTLDDGSSSTWQSPEEARGEQRASTLLRAWRGQGVGEAVASLPPSPAALAAPPSPAALATQADSEEAVPLDEPAVGGVDAWWLPGGGGSECGAYFGNGFDQHALLLRADSHLFAQRAVIAQPLSYNLPAAEDAMDAGWRDARRALAACHRAPRLDAYLCVLHNALLRPARVRLARGGEPLADVMGRAEDTELPVFLPAALALAPALPQRASAEGEEGGEGEGEEAPRLLDARAQEAAADMLAGMQRTDAYKHALLAASVVLPRAPQCALIVRAPVIFLTRMEYANLFHTATDWYNAWQAARVAGLHPTSVYPLRALEGITPEARAAERAAPRNASHPRIPAHIVFLDAHSASALDDGWRALFLSVNYARHLPPRACFHTALHAAFGYHAALSMGIQPKRADCLAHAAVRQFARDMRAGMGLPPDPPHAPCARAPRELLFLRRVSYVAHPRSKGIELRWRNEEEAYAALSAHARAAGAGALVVHNGLLSSWSLRDQLASAQRACLLVGAHGAGVTHVLFAARGAHVLEMRPPGFERPHFIALAAWAGVAHHDWAPGTHTPDTAQLVQRVQQILDHAASAG